MKAERRFFPFGAFSGLGIEVRTFGWIVVQPNPPIWLLAGARSGFLTFQQTQPADLDVPMRSEANRPLLQPFDGGIASLFDRLEFENFFYGALLVLCQGFIIGLLGNQESIAGKAIRLLRTTDS